MRDTSTRPEHTAEAAFAELTHSWVHGFAATAEATEAELTALDQQVGDGDFGANLVAGLQATLRLLAAPPPPAPPAPAADCGTRPRPTDLRAGASGADAGAAGIRQAEALKDGSAGPAAEAAPPRATAAPASAGGTAQGGSTGPTAAAASSGMVPGRVPRGTAPTAVPAPAGPAEAAARPLEAAAGAFLDEVGGTSGPLFGLLFQEIAAAVRAGGATSPTAALAAGVRNGLAAIQRVGEAEVGDKTLVDALAPAAAALASSTARDPRQALADAARAAWRGVHDTARMTARRGRASYLGDRAAGVPDPGAVGIGLLFTAASGPVTTLGPLLR